MVVIRQVTYMHTHPCTYAHTYVCTHARMHTRTDAHTHMYAHTHVCTHTHAHPHARKHHTYIAKKPSVCPSICIPLMSVDYLSYCPHIKAIFVPNKALIIRLHHICWNKFLTAFICTLWCIECNGVEDNSLKSPGMYIPVKTTYGLHEW